ncbi:hypothetical protein SLEP1_g38174 [Rubroshorea leprosula]|uniref:Uncharacterized protein n=1 Tax=Rubroshorea leprosula TaxID=152421 RepID=A0AAV5KXD5_9ROSI|nr:hypothetical protein SLEP1_g38174 [Rubroshorea leprosula]
MGMATIPLNFQHFRNPRVRVDLIASEMQKVLDKIFADLA